MHSVHWQSSIKFIAHWILTTLAWCLIPCSHTKCFYLYPFSIYNYDVWCYFTRYVHCSAPHNLIIGCSLSEYIIFIKLTLIYSNSMKQFYENNEWRYIYIHQITEMYCGLPFDLNPRPALESYMHILVIQLELL